MFKSKHYRFVPMIALATLLVIGNLLTPVQAYNLDMVTQTPTVTPNVEPENLGETVSPEEQEAIRMVVDSYFALRYRAFSTLQLDSFGDLVSEGADAQDFANSELGKLRVGLRNAELNQLRYKEYQYFLDFQSIGFDPSSGMAAVSVVENHDVIYEISIELDPKQPIVSHLYNLEHTISLRKEKDQWKIVSDDYTDYLWRMLRSKPVSLDEVLSTMQASPRPAWPNEGAGTEIVSTLPADDSSHAYDRVAAADYAINHIHAYNPAYPTYEGLGGDCTNFVSQSIYEGGNASMYIPDPLPPPSPDGQSGWYLLNELQRATDWNDVQGFYNFVTDYGFPTEGPEGSEVTLNGVMLGDVIQYDWSADGIWDHAVIVVNIVNGVPYIASHTEDVGPEPYTYFPYGDIRFIHIERSDGNPPVKAQVAAGSDDAGTNPTPCTFSLSDNEVYLGACFSGGNITGGFRFTNIRIPRNAQIKYAYMIFTVDGTYTVPINVQIYGEDIGNSPTFSVTNPPTNRSTPYSPVLWSITDQWIFRQRRTPPQLAPVIQNIVLRGDWVSGNSLSIIVKNAGSNVRRVMAFERAGFDPKVSPAKLIATYDLPTSPSSLSFNSAGTYDGWILESGENTGIGGSINSTATSFRLGDDSADKQYRSILHFNTSSLPDNAVILSATLKIKQQGAVVGTNPFTTHGSLVADIRKPYFGTGAGLAAADFQAVSGQAAIATFDPTPINSWYSAAVSTTAFPHINLTGNTQFRLTFTLDDNDDLGTDYIAFSSGNNGTATNRPQLIISYYVP